MATYKPYRKTSSGKEEIKIPYSVLSNPPNLSVYAKLAGGNTFSGNQVITGYLDIRGTAAEKHLKTCGIGGSDGNGNSSDLYLQYSSNYKTYFGNTAQSSLNADGSISINGKTVLTDASAFATAAQGTKADNAMPKKGGTFDGDVTIASGHHLKTDLIKSADDTKWIAEITSNGLEVGGSGTPLRFYSSTRPVVANQNKELAYISDIPTVNNGTLTIQKNGTTVATFSANQSGNATANITVPTFSLSGTTLTITLP